MLWMVVEQDSARVRVPPPVYLLAAILLGLGVDRLKPWPWAPEGWRWVWGGSLIGLGIGIILFCAWLFHRARTELKPWKATTAIVSRGIYGWTRNPIYLSFILIGLGVAAAADSAWVALLQLPLVAALDRWVIRKEEAYLERKFGEEYRAYARRVRRWL